MSEKLALKKTTLQGGKPGPHLLVLGGVHGDEFESMAAIRRLKRTVDASGVRGRLTLVPVVNEGAFIRGERTAEDGLDLARTCPGRPDGSITERVAHEVSSLIRTSDFLIDLHSGGNIMHFYPTVGYTLHPDSEVLDVQRRLAEAFNLPIIWGTTSQLDGRTLSVARDARIPAIYAEYMGGGICSPDGVDAYTEGCLNVMSELGMIEREQPDNRTVHTVEDDSDQSGLIQVNYQSPVDGYFNPTVKLTQSVVPGDVLGEVTDPMGETVEEIVSVQTGIVLCLRVFNRVLKGDSLGAVLVLE
ncbi:MAG: succinylglutamate desuccinylase [Candidatus Latescibacteria bacterium]|nr:succinylglutamate desuccinylase [Candidatus Latescibacterota bacterium]